MALALSTNGKFIVGPGQDSVATVAIAVDDLAWVLEQDDGSGTNTYFTAVGTTTSAAAVPTVFFGGQQASTILSLIGA